MEQAWEVVLQITVILTAALVLGGAFERIRQSAILGYLLAGVLLGPGGLGIIHDHAFIESAAELGVTLLLFSIGLEFSLSRLRSMGSMAVGGGSLQIVLTAAVIGGVGVLFGIPPGMALLLGVIVAPSSTACVLRLLTDRTELESVHGRGSLGVLLLQDMALIPLVLVVAIMSAGGSAGSIAVELGKAVGVSALLVAGLWVIIGHVLPHLFTGAALLKNRELAIILATVTALGSAWVTHHFGLSPALGAFIAGVLLAESPFASQIRADVGVLKTLFMTLFFTSIGVLADVDWIRTHFVVVVSAIAALIVVKVVVVWGTMLLFRMPHRSAMATGLCLGQAGEFSFVLAAIALEGGGLSEDAFRLLVSASLGTLFLTPFLVSRAEPFGRRFEGIAMRLRVPDFHGNSTETAREALKGHVIIAGFGPTGEAVARSAMNRGNVVVVLEMNPRSVERARSLGFEAQVGDASHEDILEHVHAGGAKAVVVTVPDHRAGVAIVHSAVRMAPHALVVARARYHRFAHEYMEAGAHVVLDEEMETGAILGERIVRGMDEHSLARIRKFEEDQAAEETGRSSSDRD